MSNQNYKTYIDNANKFLGEDMGLPITSIKPTGTPSAEVGVKQEEKLSVTSPEFKEALEILLDYMEDDERRDFEATSPEEQGEHIYTTMMKLRSAIQ